MFHLKLIVWKEITSNYLAEVKNMGTENTRLIV